MEIDLPSDLDIHPDATELVQLACGRMRDEEAGRLQRHCLVCDDCALQVRALVALREGYGLNVAARARRALGGLAPSSRLH